MSNVLAIAHKEMRSYFASPIAYIVIGFFALLFGFFYYSILDWFVRQGMQMGMMGPQQMNVNQQMIRPLFLNLSVVILFMLLTLWALTMYFAPEEKMEEDALTNGNGGAKHNPSALTSKELVEIAALF